MKAGIPIALGYFAVAIALGISAREAGFSSFSAALTSFLINASAGEYIGFSLAALGASYIEVTMMEAIANARYLLMSASLSQRLDPKTPTWQRLLLGFTITDEIFGVSLAREYPLSPYFTYGTFCVATVGWTGGTFVGAMLGDVLPIAVISALGVGLYGMFISIFIPMAKKDKIVAALIAISFAASTAATYLPLLSKIPDGIRIIALTVIISLAAAILFPRDPVSEGEGKE